MDYIIIGSYALQDIIPKYKDIDLLVRPGTSLNDLNLDNTNVYDLCEFPLFDEFAKINKSNVITKDNLFSLLHSHLFWKNKNGKYKTYMERYALLQDLGCTLNYEVVNMFYNHWENTKSSKSHIVLNTDSTDFFDDNIRRQMAHDDLHEYMKWYDRPMFKRILKDGSSVMCDKSKFENLTQFDKDLCIIEEVLVTSSERAIGFKSGVVHLITSLSKGWFADYTLTRAPMFLELSKAAKLSPEVKEFINLKFKGRKKPYVNY